jgi:hypothetical protein
LERKAAQGELTLPSPAGTVDKVIGSGRAALEGTLESAMADEEKTAPKTYPEDKAGQGEIILRTPARRVIFIGGFLVALALVLIAQYLYL